MDDVRLGPAQLYRAPHSEDPCTPLTFYTFCFEIHFWTRGPSFRLALSLADYVPGPVGEGVLSTAPF